MLVLTAQDAVDFKVAGASRRRRRLRDQAVRLRGAARAGRGARPPSEGDPRRRCSGWPISELDTATREVRRGGEPIELTPKEYTVLEYLMRHAGRVMSRTLITEYAWDYHFDPGHQHRGRGDQPARKKVDSGHARKLVHTVRGVGYVVKA